MTILGMSVGIGAILFLVSLGYGLQRTLLEKITTSDSLLTLDVAEQKSSEAFLTGDSVEKIKRIGGVEDVSPAYQLNSQGKMDDLTTDLPATVVDPLYLKLSGLRLNEGRLLNDEEKEGIIISTSVAQIFGKNAGEIIGKELDFVFFKPSLEGSSEQNNNQEKYTPPGKLRVIGVLESDDNAVYINAGYLGEISIDRFSQVKVKCVNDKVMAEAKKQIEEQGFMVSSLSEAVDQANKIFDIVKVVLMLFGIIALVVSAIGMFNTMTITLLERTEEIGIMKSIGASDMTISLIFVMESTIMGFLGGFIGIVIGWLEGEIFNGAVNLIATHFGGQKVDLFWSPLWFVLTVIIFSAFVGFLTGVIPARRASRIDPLDALRYK